MNNTVNPLKKARTFQKKRAKILLHTNLAIKMFRGYDRHHVGVPYFSKLVHSIWQAAREKDPYAELYLLRIYDSLVQARREFQNLEAHYRQCFKNEIDAELDSFIDEHPLSIPLAFTTPYAFMAAYLLTDELLRQASRMARTAEETSNRSTLS